MDLRPRLSVSETAVFENEQIKPAWIVLQGVTGAAAFPARKDKTNDHVCFTTGHDVISQQPSNWKSLLQSEKLSILRKLFRTMRCDDE